jgi:hypothetical protein
MKSNTIKNKKTVRTNTLSGKKIQRTKSKKTTTPFNYRPTKIGARKFTTSSKAAVFLLKSSKLSQSEIARRCGVSQPCVCQLAADIKR